MSYRETLVEIMKICNESSEYSRRTAAIHEAAMRSVGLTANQREERHVKAMMRSEKFKEDKKISAGLARRNIKEAVEADTGEPRVAYKHYTKSLEN